MRILLLLFSFLFITSCENYVDPPADLLPKNKMAEIMADMALNDQAITFNSSANLEVGTRYILKKYHIKPDNFVSSYKYYLVKNKIPEIIEKSQTIIKENDPEAEKYIENKLKENPTVPPFSR